MLQVKNGKVYVNGKATIDPTLIGLAVLDEAEEHSDKNLGILKFYEVYHIEENESES